MSRLLLFGVLIGYATACTKSQDTFAAWRVRFVDAALQARSAAIDTNLAKGTCESFEVVYSAQVGQASQPPPLPPGRYALMARARDAQCVWFAEGCTEVMLPAPDGIAYTVELQKSASEEVAPACTPNGNPIKADGGSPPINTNCDPSKCEGKRCISTTECGYYKTCKDMHNQDFQNAFSSGVYTFDLDGTGAAPTYKAYCEMSADNGGWTLLMKLDGSKSTFGYAQPIWIDRSTLAQTSLDMSETEAKLMGFDFISFTSIRLGMKAADGMTRWLTADAQGTSLYDVLSTQSYLATNAGRSAWLGLLPPPASPISARLQPGIVPRAVEKLRRRLSLGS